MQKTLFSKGWRVNAPGTNGWKNIDLPHDFAVTRPRTADAPGGGSNGYFNGGCGTYQKFFTPDENAEHVILDIDGAYMCAEISLNEDMLAFHPHGYTPFLCDLTDRLMPGKTNKISIITDDNMPSTRWYAGAGIYRDVYLWTGGKVRVEPRDVFVYTEEICGDVAVIAVEYLVSSDINGFAAVEARIEGTEVGEKKTVRVSAGEKIKVRFRLVIPSPRIWSPENPELNTLKTTVTYNGEVTDTADTVFGIRTLTVDAVRGLRINGKSYKLRGGCIHHDHGVLGAAAFPAAEERKITLLKEAGFNAVRIAHNPPSLALLEVCDRLGMLVMDEAFDMWCMDKGRHDYHFWFADWYERDISYMVTRDRNHPCVIAYSIGNEIRETAGYFSSGKWAGILADAIRSYDTTRPITSAQWATGIGCGWDDPEDYRKTFDETHNRYNENGDEVSWPERTEPYYSMLDMAGYNYAYTRYEQDHKQFPNRVIWGSETHAIDIHNSWNIVKNNNYVIGDFTWTAYDNLGESGTGRALWARDGVIKGISIAPYPYRSCYQGDLDLCGYRRPQSYFRENVWLDSAKPAMFTTHPMHNGEGYTGTRWHWYDVLDRWTFEDEYISVPVKTDVYTNSDEVVFILNGREAAKVKTVDFCATAEIPYEPGTLTAVTYKNGAESGRVTLSTVGKAAKFTAEPEKKSCAADGRDLMYVRISVSDADGNRVPDAANELKCAVDGAELLGVFSGCPDNEDQYGSDTCHAFYGRAMAILRSYTPGKAKLTVSADGLKAAEIELTFTE